MSTIISKRNQTQLLETLRSYGVGHINMMYKMDMILLWQRLYYIIYYNVYILCIYTLKRNAPYATTSGFANKIYIILYTYLL